MKKPSKTATRLVIWSTIGSLTISSCGEAVVDLVNYDQINQVVADYGETAIKINLNEEQRVELSKFQSIISRIISDQTFAKQFAQEPQKYMISNLGITRAGESEDAIIVDDLLVKIAQSMADQRVLDAIETKNIPEYLKLMNEKGLIDSDLYNNSDLSQIFTDEQKLMIFDSLGYKKTDQVGPSPVIVLGMFIFVAAAFALWVSIVAWNKVDIAGHSNLDSLIASDAFTVWLLKEAQEAKYQDSEIEQYLTEIVSTMNQNNINCTNVDIKKTEATIVLNQKKSQKSLY